MQSDAFSARARISQPAEKPGQAALLRRRLPKSPRDAPFALPASGISSVQLGFGLLDLGALEQGTLAAAQARGLGIIVRGCLGGGLLKDGPDEEQLRAMTPKWQRILALRQFATRMGRPLPDIALQFCRDTSGVSVIAGRHAYGEAPAGHPAPCRRRVAQRGGIRSALSDAVDGSVSGGCVIGVRVKISVCIPTFRREELLRGIA